MEIQRTFFAESLGQLVPAMRDYSKGDAVCRVAYRGVVKVDRLLEDVKLLKLPPREYLDAVLPYTGKWYRPPLFPNTINGNLGWLATALEVGGHLDESLRYWRGYFVYNKKTPRPTDQNDARLWNQELTRIQTEEAGKIFVHAGRLDDAIRACEEALKIRPYYLDLLAAAFAETGQFEQATQTMQRAIELAHSAGNPTLVGQFEARQKKYARGEPLRSR